MFQHTADELYEIIQSDNYDLESKHQAIADLKAHIKRDFVDLSQVPRYFEALKIANKSQDFKLSSLAFSSVCHLVKRVGMQDPTSLRNSSKTVLPILINRLLDPKSNFKSQAKSSLETFWLATPSIVENYIRDTALIHSNFRIRSESIVFISDLIELNKNFEFFCFLPNLVNLLRDDSIEVVKNVEVLLLKYFTFNKNKLHELVLEFKSQKIEAKRAVKILRDLDLAAANAYAAESKAQPSKPTIDTFSNLARSKKSIPSLTSHLSRPSSSSALSVAKELPEILAKIQTAKLDDSIVPIPVRAADDILREAEKLLPPFQGKETEFNWNGREKSIVRFRGLVVANFEAYPEELVQATRTLWDGINKATLSLRTTLSSNGCQLVKELAVYLTKYIDPIAEVLFQPLASLTSATKKIASLNSFGSIAVLLTNTSFNSRLFNQCFSLYQEKNVQPRLYSSTFLQIFLLKHGSKLDSLNLDTSVKWLTKGVADPNTTVRESMRVTFWIFYRKFKEHGDTLFLMLDSNVQKNLERSRPNDIKSPLVTSKTKLPSTTRTGFGQQKRQSVREFVAAKQRDKRATSSSQLTSTREQQQPQRPQPNEYSGETNTTQPSISEIGRPNRIGVPQRVRPSSGEFQPLQRQISRGSLQHQIHHQQNASISPRDGTIDINQDLTNDANLEKIEELKKLLRSPLTRERTDGVHQLEKLLLSGDTIIPDLSSTLFNLVILDTLLLNPLLNHSHFFKIIDISLALKVLAINKRDLSILLDTLDAEKVIYGLVSLVRSLELLKFDNAPSTMFHIKYKNLFLDFAIQSAYSILASDQGEGLKSDSVINKEICQVMFPLCISDYPRYDELILLLHSQQPNVFQEVLSGSTAYIKSKISSILDEFRDNGITEVHNENSFTDHGLKDMTMINPLNRSANDPTISMRNGFSTDMTMIMPNIKGNVPASEACIKELNEEDQMDVDLVGEDMKAQTDNDDQKVEYLSDIFNPSRENIKEVGSEGEGELEIKENLIGEIRSIGPIMPSTTENSDHETETESNRGLSHSPHSPFLDDYVEDDRIDGRFPTHELTENITSKISEIYISPEKKMFKTPDRKSLNSIIDHADPFFSRAKKHIEIFEDSPAAVSQQVNKRLVDFELSKFDLLMQEEEISIRTITELSTRLQDDQISNKELNKLIKSLHQLINDEDILNWIRQSGFRQIMSSLVHYFNKSINITKQLCYKGLIVFKELLIVSEYLGNLITLEEVMSIWNIMTMIVENLKDFKNGIFISIDELVDDLLDLNLSGNKLEIIKSCCVSLKTQKDHLLLTSFYLLTLTKCIERESLTLEQIKDIDSTVFKYLSYHEVEVRRLTIIIYSKCKRKLQEFDQNSSNDHKFEGHRDEKKIAHDTYNDVFQKLSLPQRKLVDYYCEN